MATRRRAAGGLLAALVVLLALTVGPATPAGAHTELDSTDPGDGSTSSRPVTTVELTFTLPVTVLGDGVVVEGPDGPVPVEVGTEQDGEVLVATPEAPLAGGEYSITWTAAARDGHPLEGALGFTVDEEPEPGGTPTAEAGADAPDADRDADDAAGDGGTDGDAAGRDGDAAPDDPSVAGGGLRTIAQVAARLGDAAVLWGGMVAGGGLLFAGLVLRGRDRADRPAVLAVVRWTGALVLLGVGVRVLAWTLLVSQGDIAATASVPAVTEAVAGPLRRVVAAQAAGGLAILVGTWRSLPGSWLAVLGALAVGAGAVMDGHSNVGDPRWLVLAASGTHLVAAAVWVGGVVVLGVLLRRRRRDGRPPGAALLGARFSRLAAASVALVGVAGVALAVTVLERPAQLWESSWGQLLLAKVVVVALVAAIGAYNHFRVVPVLEADVGARRSRGAGNVLRRSAGRETALMVAVVLLTAWLVAASVHG